MAICLSPGRPFPRLALSHSLQPGSGTRVALNRCLSWLLVLLALVCPLIGQENIITEILVHNNRRIPVDTIKARLFTRAGDVYDPAALERDFNSLWNTGYFEDIRITREETP